MSTIVSNSNRRVKALPTQETLRRYFDYDPVLGELIRRERPRSEFARDQSYKTFNVRFCGKRLRGVLNDAGYVVTNIWYNHYRVHRLIWAWHHGEIPDGLYIDHKNGVRHDNRIENLQLVNLKENARNTKVRSHTKSGCSGVTYDKVNKKWRCIVSLNGKRFHLGRFSRKKDAIGIVTDFRKANGFSERHGK